MKALYKIRIEGKYVEEFEAKLDYLKVPYDEKIYLLKDNKDFYTYTLSFSKYDLLYLRVSTHFGEISILEDYESGIA